MWGNCAILGSCLMSEKESQHSSHKTVIAVQKTVIVVASLASVIVVIVAIVIVYTASRKSKLTDWCYKNVRSKFSREVTFFSLHKNHQKQNESTEDAVYTISAGWLQENPVYNQLFPIFTNTLMLSIMELPSILHLLTTRTTKANGRRNFNEFRKPIYEANTRKSSLTQCINGRKSNPVCAKPATLLTNISWWTVVKYKLIKYMASSRIHCQVWDFILYMDICLILYSLHNRCKIQLPVTEGNQWLFLIFAFWNN